MDLLRIIECMCLSMYVDVCLCICMRMCKSFCEKISSIFRLTQISIQSTECSQTMKVFTTHVCRQNIYTEGKKHTHSRKIENERKKKKPNKRLNFWKERKMFGIKIHKIPSTKDNDNECTTQQPTLTMKSCDSENLVVCIVIMLLTAPRHIFTSLFSISFYVLMLFYFSYFFSRLIVVDIVIIIIIILSHRNETFS